MSENTITIKIIIDRVLRRAGLPIDGTGAVTRLDCLEYFNEARRAIGRLVPITRGNARAAAVIDQIEYDIPQDFESNLFRVDYDYKPLIETNFATLDEYDEYWRDSRRRDPSDTVPKYFMVDTENQKIIIYPPPTETGEVLDFTEDGVPESITVGNETIDLLDVGVMETLTIGGEEFFFNEDGVPEVVILQAKNFKFYYEKIVADYANENGKDFDIFLQPHQDLILYNMLATVYSTKIYKNDRLASRNDQLFGVGVTRIRRKLRVSRPPLYFTVKKLPGRMWGRRGNG